MSEGKSPSTRHWPLVPLLVYCFPIIGFLTTKIAKDTKVRIFLIENFWRLRGVIFSFLRERRELRGQICCFFFPSSPLDPPPSSLLCSSSPEPEPRIHSPLFARAYLLWEITCVKPAMETEGASNRPSVRLGNGGSGVNLKGSDPPGAISPDIVG